MAFNDGFLSPGYVSTPKRAENTPFIRSDSMRATPQAMEAGVFSSIAKPAMKFFNPRNISAVGKNLFGKGMNGNMRVTNHLKTFFNPLTSLPKDIKTVSKFAKHNAKKGYINKYRAADRMRKGKNGYNTIGRGRNVLLGTGAAIGGTTLASKLDQIDVEEEQFLNDLNASRPTRQEFAVDDLRPKNVPQDKPYTDDMSAQDTVDNLNGSPFADYLRRDTAQGFMNLGRAETSDEMIKRIVNESSGNDLSGTVFAEGYKIPKGTVSTKKPMAKKPGPKKPGPVKGSKNVAKVVAKAPQQRFATVDPLNLFGNRNGANPFNSRNKGSNRYSGGIVESASPQKRSNTATKSEALRSAALKQLDAIDVSDF